MFPGKSSYLEWMWTPRVFNFIIIVWFSTFLKKGWAKSGCLMKVRLLLIYLQNSLLLTKKNAKWNCKTLSLNLSLNWVITKYFVRIRKHHPIFITASWVARISGKYILKGREDVSTLIFPPPPLSDCMSAICLKFRLYFKLKFQDQRASIHVFIECKLQ